MKKTGTTPSRWTLWKNVELGDVPLRGAKAQRNLVGKGLAPLNTHLPRCGEQLISRLETSEEEEGWAEPGGGRRVALLPSVESPPPWLPPHRVPPPAGIFTHPVRRLVFSRAPQGLWLSVAPSQGSSTAQGEGDLSHYLDGLSRLMGRRAGAGPFSSASNAAAAATQQWVAMKCSSAAEALAEREKRLKVR